MSRHAMCERAKCFILHMPFLLERDVEWLHLRLESCMMFFRPVIL